MKITAENLNSHMEFDHVVEVTAGGAVIYAPDSIHAPNLHEGELDTEGWTLMDGYSGQDRYAGPIMHNSESIGGRMATDILSNPGYYVALVGYWDTDTEDDDNVEGWAVAFMPTPTPA